MKKTLNKLLKVLSSIVFVFLVLIILLIIFYIARINYLAKNDRLGDIHLNFYTILTQSMHPAIKAGDVVITYRHDDNKYKKGDVITFVSNANGGINITHRIEKVYDKDNNPSYKTKGDNNSAPDNEIVEGKYIQGKVFLTLPKVGYIQQFLVSKTGWIIAIVLPAMGIIIYDILKIFKAAFKKNKQLEQTTEVVAAKQNLESVLNNQDTQVADSLVNENKVDSTSDAEDIEIL